MKSASTLEGVVATSLSEGEVLALCRAAKDGNPAPVIPAPPLLAFRSVPSVEASFRDGRGYCGEARAIGPAAAFDWVFASHFAGDPVIPGLLLVDGLYQLAGVVAGLLGFSGKGRAVRLGKTKFVEAITPARSELEYILTITGSVNRRQIIFADGTVRCDGRTSVLAEGLVLTILP